MTRGRPSPSRTGSRRAMPATAGARPCTTTNATSVTSRIVIKTLSSIGNVSMIDVLERAARHVDDSRDRFVVHFGALERVGRRGQQAQSAAVPAASDDGGASCRGDPARESRRRCWSLGFRSSSIAQVPICSDASMSSTSSGCRSASPQATLTAQRRLADASLVAEERRDPAPAPPAPRPDRRENSRSRTARSSVADSGRRRKSRTCARSSSMIVAPSDWPCSSRSGLKAPGNGRLRHLRLEVFRQRGDLRRRLRSISMRIRLG